MSAERLMSAVIPVAIAFEGQRRLAEGALADVARAVKRASAREHDALLVFSLATGRVIDLNLSGDEAAVEQRYAQPATPEPEAVTRGPGRPKLGVVAREVTLLPRHWDWLATQPGGASVTIRKLVEAAKRGGEQQPSPRAAQEATYHFMRVMAGNLPLYEEAARALFASDLGRFTELTQNWPTDVRDHARRLATVAFDASAHRSDARV